MNVNERANLARARLIYYAALATGKLTDPLSVKRLEEMRSLSDPPRRPRVISPQRLRELVRESLHRYRRGTARLAVRRRGDSKFDSLKHPRIAKGRRGAGQFCRSDQREGDEPTPESTPSKPRIDPSTLPPLSQKWQGKGTTGWDITALEDQHDDVLYQARYVGIARGRMQYTFRRYSLGKLVVVKHDSHELQFVELNGKYLTRDRVRYIAANSLQLLDEDDWDFWFQTVGADSTESLIPKRPETVPITLTEEWRRAHERNTPERQIEPPAEPAQPAARNAQKPAELNGLKATDDENGNWVVWDRQGNRIGEYSNGTIFRDIADTRARMTAGTFSLPLSEVKRVDSWYWHSPDDDKEWDDWFIDHGRYVSQLIVPEISWEQLSTGSTATSANPGQPLRAAAVQVQPQIWALTWHVMKGALEKYIGGRIISCVVNRGLELVITRADGRIFRVPLQRVREWGQNLLRTKDSKKAAKATELIDDGLRRLGMPTGGNGVHPNSKSSGVSDFAGILRKSKVTLPGVRTQPIRYQKIEKVAANSVRAKFNSTHRRSFLQGLANDPAKVEQLKAAGLTEANIAGMKLGIVPTKYRVHHKIPVDAGGSNEASNLILILEEPYHKTITNFQNELIRGMKPGDFLHVDYPLPDGFIYPP